MEKTIIVGDIHGDLNCFLIPLFEYLKSPFKSRLIYLGDYIDRGDYSLAIYNLMKTIINSNNIIFKNCIFLRGNHEDTYCTPNNSLLLYEYILLNLPIFYAFDLYTGNFVDSANQNTIVCSHLPCLFKTIFSINHLNKRLKAMENPRDYMLLTTGAGMFNDNFFSFKDLEHPDTERGFFAEQKRDYKHIYGHCHTGNLESLYNFINGNTNNCCLDFDISIGYSQHYFVSKPSYLIINHGNQPSMIFKTAIEINKHYDYILMLKPIIYLTGFEKFNNHYDFHLYTYNHIIEIINSMINDPKSYIAKDIQKKYTFFTDLSMNVKTIEFEQFLDILQNRSVDKRMKNMFSKIK